MDYVTESFRHGEVTLNNIPEYRDVWDELQGVMKSIILDKKVFLKQSII